MATERRLHAAFAGLVVLALFAAACGTGSQPAPRAGNPSGPTPTVHAVDVALARERVDEWRADVHAFGVSAAIRVPGHDDVFVAAGVDGRHPETPMPATGVFSIASITKTFVASVVLQLVGDSRRRLARRGRCAARLVHARLSGRPGRRRRAGNLRSGARRRAKMSTARAGLPGEVRVDGIHDMGGTQGWGTVTIPPDEPVFAEPWEAKAFAFGALSARLSGQNLNAMRHAIDRQHPYDYLADGYYGRWLGCVETMLVDSGVLAPGAVVARARKLRGEDVTEPDDPTPNKPDYQPTAAGSLRQIDAPPRFAVGDRVHAKAHAPAGHTRLPRYTRGHVGTVATIHPAQVLPDTNAHFIAENAQQVYAVAFDSRELWGDDAEPFTLTLDLYDDYLEPIE